MLSQAFSVKIFDRKYLIFVDTLFQMKSENISESDLYYVNPDLQSWVTFFEQF